MKPGRFELQTPQTLGGAVSLLTDLAGEARVLAGGQSLMPELNSRLIRPRVLVDINRVPGLDAIEVDEEGALRVGALVRQRALELSPAVAERCRLLPRAMRHVGSFQTRNRGTVGGSIAHADPAAELPAVALALEARMTVAGPRGVREIDAGRFFRGPNLTALEVGELLVGVRFLPVSGSCALEEVTVRGRGGPALVAVAVADGRIALAGAGATPVRAHRAEAALSAAGVEAAADAAADEVEPVGDLRADREYRRALARALTKRALTKAEADAAQG